MAGVDRVESCRYHLTPNAGQRRSQRLIVREQHGEIMKKLIERTCVRREQPDVVAKWAGIAPHCRLDEHADDGHPMAIGVIPVSLLRPMVGSAAMHVKE